MICNWYQRYKGRNWDYCSHFSVILEITSKFLIVFVRLILTKARVGRFTGPLREIVFRYEFGLQIISIDLWWKQRFLQPFLVEFPISNYIYHFFCQIDITERWGWQIYQATTGKWRQIRKWFTTHINGIKVEIEIIAANFQRFFKQQVNF